MPRNGVMKPNDLAAALMVGQRLHPDAVVEYDHEYGINLHVVSSEPTSMQRIIMQQFGWEYHATLRCYFPKALKKEG